MRIKILRANARSTACFVLVLALLLDACTQNAGSGQTTNSSVATTSRTTTSRAAAATTTALSATGKVPATASDLKANNAHHVLPVNGETFSLRVDYWTTLASAGWLITGPKNVHLAGYLAVGKGSLPQVMIDGFESDLQLVALIPGLNGLTVAEMSDRSPAPLPGLEITSTVSYGTEFQVAGIPDALVERWQYLAPGQALTEAALLRAGVYAQRFTFRYDLLVRSTGDANWHRRVVTDQLTVPLGSTSG